MSRRSFLFSEMKPKLFILKAQQELFVGFFLFFVLLAAFSGNP